MLVPDFEHVYVDLENSIPCLRAYSAFMIRVRHS
uniref:Uncharacterized protein n=1 Tax=Anguilla anguilla TaxID=7936 RepID=A0A0E9Y2J9_ANGAN